MACPRCDDVGFEIVSRDGREYAKACGCRRATEGSDAALMSARIPLRYEHCSLASFTPGEPSLSTALEKAMMFCTGYPHLGADEGLGLLLTGDNGLGKTHLAVAILRELITTKGVSGTFWDFHALIREIKSSYDPETKTSELMVLQPVVEVDLLVLDDLGAWKMTDWMNDTLFYILNSRYLAKRATVITTNYEEGRREQARAAADDSNRFREFLVERIGQRLYSRLMEMCLIVRLHGKDHRQARQVANEAAIRVPRPR
jgi:DNA replication protein DnaC